MTHECPLISPTASYPIGKAAILLGISPRHLLRLAMEGTVKYTVNRANGKKYFSGKELLRYWWG